MDINALSKGTIFYIIFPIILIYFIQFNNYDISFELFTAIILIGVVINGYYTARISRKRGLLNSFLMGLLSSVILTFIISNYVDYSWYLNVALVFIWTSASLTGGFFGNKIRLYDE